MNKYEQVAKENSRKNDKLPQIQQATVKTDLQILYVHEI